MHTGIQTQYSHTAHCIRTHPAQALRFWLLLLLVLYDMYCGRCDRVLLCILPVLLWGTYLLGPVMQGRYLYPFICVLPLFLFRRRAADAKAY